MNNNYPKDVNLHWAKFKCPICKAIVKPTLNPAIEPKDDDWSLQAIIGIHFGKDHYYSEDIIWTKSLGIEIIERYLSFNHKNYSYNISEEPELATNNVFTCFSKTKIGDADVFPFTRAPNNMKELSVKNFSKRKAINKINLMLAFA